MNWFIKWFQTYCEWRIRLEWKRKFPDPLIVCPVWRNCCAVDNWLCEPKTCEMLKLALEKGAEK